LVCMLCCKSTKPMYDIMYVMFDPGHKSLVTRRMAAADHCFQVELSDKAYRQSGFLHILCHAGRGTAAVGVWWRLVASYHLACAAHAVWHTVCARYENIGTFCRR
jgi:hypothetical protein